jgi:hypothetical protein
MQSTLPCDLSTNAKRMIPHTTANGVFSPILSRNDKIKTKISLYGAGVLISMWANPLVWPLEGVVPESRDFSLACIGNRCHSGPKNNLDFQGPPLPMALEMGLPAWGGTRGAWGGTKCICFLALTLPTMRANPFRGSLEEVGPENQDFLGPEMATAPPPPSPIPIPTQPFVQNNLKINSDK